MQYLEFVTLYEKLASTTKRLEKTSILSEFLKKLKKQDDSQWVYLLKGRVFPEYDPREFGISDRLTMKAIAKASGSTEEHIFKEYRKIGDFGELAETFLGKRKQSTLFSSKLTVKKVFENLKNLAEFEGKGTVEKKLSLITELLNSATGQDYYKSRKTYESNASYKSNRNRRSISNMRQTCCNRAQVRRFPRHN